MSDTVDVKQYFTRAAASFDSLYLEDAGSIARFINRRFRRDIYERFMLTLNHVERFKLETVLDVGCGSGRYAVALAQMRVKRIVGLDISDGMIGLARKLATENGTSEQIEFWCGDFMDYRSATTFQTVIAMGFFDYIRDPLPVLARMRSLTEHSVIASFPSISWYRTPIRKTRYVIKRCPVFFYQRNQIEQFGRKSGFARTEVHKIEGAGQDYFVTFYNPGAIPASAANSSGASPRIA
jgi:SAM-dependent methyltransferase